MTVEIKSRSRISEDFRKTVTFLKQQAIVRYTLLRGDYTRLFRTQLDGDVGKRDELPTAFPYADIEKQIDDIQGDDSVVGDAEDLRVVAIQSDAQAMCRRALRSHRSSRVERKLQAAHRHQTHGADNGIWETQYINKVQSILRKIGGG